MPLDQGLEAVGREFRKNYGQATQVVQAGALIVGYGTTGGVAAGAIVVAVAPAVAPVSTFIAGNTRTVYAVAPAVGVVAKATSAFQRMLQAGLTPDRGGLTIAGRALEKHGSRVGSVFPRAVGNIATKNAQGQQVLQKLLSSSNQVIEQNRFGGRDIYDVATGQGVRYDASSVMMGFLEPR